MRRGNRPAGGGAPADGLLLASGLFGILLFFLRTYRIVTEPLLLTGTALGMTVLVSLFMIRPGTLRYLVLLLAAGGLPAAWVHRWILVAGGYGVYAQVAEVLTEATGFPGVRPPLYDPPGPDGTLYVTWFLVALTILLALALGEAIRRRNLWLVLLFTLPVTLPAFLAELPPHWPSLLPVCALWITLLLAHPAARRDRTGGGRLILRIYPILLGTLFLLVFLVPPEGYSPPGWTVSARQGLYRAGDRVVSLLGQDPALSPPGGRGSVDLTSAGPRRFTGRTVLQVDTGVRERLYLRGDAAAVYTETAWGPPDRETLAELPPYGQEALQLFFPAITLPEEEIHSAVITRMGLSDTLIYYPYQPAGIAGGGDFSVSLEKDLYLEADRNVAGYTALFRLARPEEAGILQGELAAREEEYRQYVYRNYLEVPETTRAQLEQWRTQVEEETEELYLPNFPDSRWGETLQAAARTVWLLDRHTRYDGQTPYTPVQEDFAGYFLLESGRGYCMHYATAAALLLRMEGIPTRYVSGYTALADESGTALVPDSAAHAWVEIYLDGYGWHPVEATPAAAFEEEVLPEPSSPGDGETPGEEPQEPADPANGQAPAEAEEPQPGEDPVSGGSEFSGWWFLLAGLLIPGWRAVLWIRWKRFMEEADNNRAAVLAYGFFQELKPWGGTVGTEAMERIQKARFSQHTLTRPERELVVKSLREEIRRTGDSLSGPRKILFRYLRVPGNLMKHEE